MSTLLTIPLPCTLEHLVGEESLSLGRPGPLSLVLPPPEEKTLGAELEQRNSKSSASNKMTTTSGEEAQAGTQKEGDDDDGEDEIAKKLKQETESSTIVVILKVGDLAFPLSKKTPFGTTNQPFSYLFKPFLPGLPPGWVKLSFPSSTSQAFPDASNSTSAAETKTTTIQGDKAEDTNPELIKLRDAFETVLIDLGLLTDSLVLSSADDIGQSTRAALGGLAQSIDRRAQTKISTTDGASEEEQAQIGEGTKRFVGGIDDLAQGVRDVSGSLTGALQSGVAWVGNEVGKRLPAGKKEEVEQGVQEKAEAGEPEDSLQKEELSTWATTKQASGAIFGGVADGSTTLVSQASRSTRDVVTHTKGDEAGQVVEHVSNAAANVGGTASDAIVGTSSILLGGIGLKAAAEADRSQGAKNEGGVSTTDSINTAQSGKKDDENLEDGLEVVSLK